MKRGLIGLVVVVVFAGLVWTSSVCGVVGGLDELVLRGDVNADGSINISDPVSLQNHLYSGGPPPPCWDAADANFDGAVDISDSVFLTNYLFSGGPAPQGYANCY